MNPPDDDERSSSQHVSTPLDQLNVQHYHNALRTGDTLIVLASPHDRQIYDAAGLPLSQVNEIRVESQRLRDCHSPILDDCLSYESQLRCRRRAGFIRNPVPPGVKYIVRLKPPGEGDVLVDLMSRLYAPRGIVHWSCHAKDFSVPKQFVSGADDTDIMAEASVRKTMLNRTDQELELANLDQVPAYSPVRHRACIERLLQIIHGKQVLLDSAVKVWTIAQLAGYFEIDHPDVVCILIILGSEMLIRGRKMP